MLNRAHVKINYQKLADAFQLGSNRYKKPGGMLGTIMNRNSRDKGQTRLMAFRIAEDISRNPPVHAFRKDRGWSERVELVIKPSRINKSVSFDLQIKGTTRLVSASERAAPNADGEKPEDRSPFIGIHFTRSGDARTATVTKMVLQGREIPVTQENFDKLLTLAGMTAAQILSGSRTSFLGNLQRVYGNNTSRRQLRRLMATGRPAPRPAP